MTAPTLTTERLALRPLTKATTRVVEWLNDPQIVQFSEQRHRTHTLASEARYVASFKAPHCLWGIHLIETGKHIGNLSATVDEPNKVADIGIMIGDRDNWGRGYGTESWKAACDWLLSKDGGNLRKLEAGFAATNFGMKNILRKTGWSFEAEHKLSLLIGGSPVSTMHYGRFV